MWCILLTIHIFLIFVIYNFFEINKLHIFYSFIFFNTILYIIFIYTF